jgi:hypothetical protein
MDLKSIAAPAATVLGSVILIGGIALESESAALIVAGVLLLVFGLFVLDDGRAS